jgi:FAD:protein FMN transferase
MPSSQKAAALQPMTFRFKAMGTFCELKCYVDKRSSGQHLAQQVQADIQRLEQRYSRYRADSLLSQINAIALQGGAIEVDAETAGLLDYADTCYRQSDGLFDITSGILRRAWRFEHNELPDPQMIAALLQHIGWQKLQWRAPHLIFNQPGMEIDLGGVVKEYAADRAATRCLNAGVGHALINLGGDIRVVGPHPNGEPWIIGVQHPRKPGEVLHNVALHSGGMACSGDYERCIVIDGERYSHIINPKTGWPVRYMASVCVLGDFCLVAGSAATIGMLKERQGPVWLQQLGLPHIWVNIHGESGGH